MKITTLTNLLPRPDQPHRGLYNYQFFKALRRFSTVQNTCIVPSYRLDQWNMIASWQAPRVDLSPVNYIPAFYIPWVGRNLSWYFYELAIKKNLAAIGHPDAIFATWLYPDGVAAINVAKDLSIPCWVKIHGSDIFHLNSTIRKKIILNSSQDANGFICVNKPLADRLQQEGIPQSKIHIIPNGVDKNKFQNRSMSKSREKLQLEQGITIVLFIGNLVEVKGPEVLLAAWNDYIKDDGTGSPKLIYIGTGAMKDSLEEEVKRNNLSNNVRFVGQISHEDIPMWLSAADCLCLSSLHEGMPNVILEAMASGIKILATDVGACREMMQGYSIGRVVAPNDPERMAKALADLIEQPTQGEDIVACAASIPSWEEQAKKFIKIVSNY